MPRLATAEVVLTRLAVTSTGWDSGAVPGPAAASGSGQADVTAGPHRLTRAVTLAFAGDLHFQLHWAALLDTRATRCPGRWPPPTSRRSTSRV
jgi:hypothetical protein